METDLSDVSNDELVGELIRRSNALVCAYWRKDISATGEGKDLTVHMGDGDDPDGGLAPLTGLILLSKAQFIIQQKMLDAL